MNILMIGFGSLGQGLLPLLDQYIPNSKIFIIAADKLGESIAKKYNSCVDVMELTKNNYKNKLNGYKIDLLINVSVNVSSISLIKYCQRKSILYIDTSIEPWAGKYKHMTNYCLRHQALKQFKKPYPSALICHGANPGLISHMVKAALDQLKDIFKLEGDYGYVAHELGIKAIQVAEKDTQISSLQFSKNTFVNTWSVDGFVSELKQYAEIGTKEKFKKFKYHCFGRDGVYLKQEGYLTKVKSWVPSCGSHVAYLVPHHEATSISSMLEYNSTRPTVYFAYKPCPQAIRSFGLLNKKIKHKAIIKEDIVSGHDELGALLISEYFSYWFGSVLGQVEVPHNSATSLQVNISIIAGIIYIINHPNEGVIEAEDLPHHFVLNIAKPYLGDYGGVFTDFKMKSTKFKDFLI